MTEKTPTPWTAEQHAGHGSPCETRADGTCAGRGVAPRQEQIAEGDDSCVRLATLTAGIGYPVRCPHCGPGAGPVPATHWTKHVMRHHPEAPAPAPDGLTSMVDDLIESYLLFLRGRGPEPDLSALPPGRRAQVLEQQEIVSALADRDPALPPVEDDPVALRLGLVRAAPGPLREQIAAALEGAALVSFIADDGHPAMREATGEALADAVLAVPAIRDQQARLERAEAELAAERETSRRLLAQRQEMAAERYAWQERGDKAEHRLRLAHEARRAKAAQLDEIKRAMLDVGLMDDDDPYSHADLADVIRQTAAGDRDAAEAGRDALKKAHVALAEQAGKDQAAIGRVREFAADIERAGWSQAAIARRILAELNPQEQPPGARPTHPDGTPYRYADIAREGWEHCDGCGMWGNNWTPEDPHECPTPEAVAALNPQEPS
ncbi:hypothetical protein [Streptomyces sp. NPDC005407]|uniref:hypothetical protein n=1 Tax=Streptomyces sp. NPDC005407 TaxID=3155340 RepID=UPI0033A73A2B